MLIILQKILRKLSSAVLKKYKPRIIGITGSVGKTSAKEAICAVLSSKYKVRKSAGNYNNEIGAPLTILGKETAGKSLFKWIGIFFYGLRLLWSKNTDYPEILVLEIATDKPGDIDYLLGFISLDTAVVTAVASVHTGFFKDIEGVFREKQSILKNLKEDSYAVLNLDDEYVSKMREHTRGKIATFGFKKNADIKCVDFNLNYRDENKILSGVSFKLAVDENEAPVRLYGVIGKQSIYAALAATTVGVIYRCNLIEISESLKSVEFPAGRMRLIPGIKNSILIDDSYNASPRSTLAALETIKEIAINQENKKYAVLGDMLELGAYTEKGHQEVGKCVAENKIDVFIAVGEKMEDAITAAINVGMSEDRIFKFSKPEDAGLFIQERMKQGDLILIKGSRKMKMEKITEELMAEPLKAKELLVC